VILVGLILTLAIGAAILQDSHSGSARFLKLSASTAVIALLFVHMSGTSSYVWFLLAAFSASWFGDLALTFEGRGPFMLGLISFAVAHMMYIAAFIVRAPIEPLLFAIAGVAMVGVGLAILRWLGPHRPLPLRVPLIAYVWIISTMVTIALATQGAAPSSFIALGAVAFAGSDMLVAREQFVAVSKWNRIIGLPLYFGAQTLFALTV